MEIKTSTVLSLAFIGAHFYTRIKRNSPPTIHYTENTGNYNAAVIPPFGIYINKSQEHNVELLNHELVHWQQFQRMGLIPFYFKYWKEINSVGYDNSPMEIEARYNESEYCKNNYTECVRNGTSKTVSNPNFRT